MSEKQDQTINTQAQTIREQNAQKQGIAGAAALFVAAGVAGAFLALGFIAPDPVSIDPKAEYCRGVADGDTGNYTTIRNFVIDLEDRAAQQGVEVALVAMTSDGVILEQIALSSRFPERPADYVQAIEDACNAFTTAEQFATRFGRGPSNLTTTTTVG